MERPTAASSKIVTRPSASTILRISGIFIFVLIGALISIYKPFAPDLSSAGHIALTATIVAVGLWVFGGKWLPIAIGGVVLLLILIASGMKYSLVFNGFTYRALWILIPALFFGFTLTATGLGRRIAYWVIGMFKPSYLTLTISWVIIALLLSILTPSITVRMAIVVPIAVAVGEICKLQYGSNGASFILLVAWSMVLIPGTGWLTGSLWGPMGIGWFGSTPGLEGIINFGSWLHVMLVPAMVLTVVFIVLMYKFMKPKEGVKVDREIFRAEYKAMGPMSFREKASLLILCITFLLLVTAQVHKIPDVAICLGAFVLLVIVGVIKANDIGSGISWNLVIFFGAAMGLNSIFLETGVSKFLGDSFSPMVGSLAANPWIFLFAIFLIFILWRFLDVTQLYTTMSFILPFMPMLSTDFGINPLIIYAIVIMAGNFFLVGYMQPFVIMAESTAGKASWSSGQLRKAGILYFIACLITLAVTIPYWMGAGLIK